MELSIWTIFLGICKYFIYLYLIQLALQIIGMAIKEYYLRNVHQDAVGRGPLGIPYIREVGEIVGLTGDNSIKKRIIEHTAWKTFTLPLVSSLLFFHFECSFPIWMNLCLSGLFVGLLKLTGIFFLFKIYTGTGKGAGFNLYLNGWRIIGLDYHSWQVKQHPITGKPLGKDEQYFSPARPHIDIPFWHLHHWPWEQHTDHDTLEELKQEASERRSAQLVKKMAKKASRADKVRQRNLAAPLEDPTSQEQKEEDIVDLTLFS